MADPLDTELVSDGAQAFKVDLVANDGITPTIKEVVAFLQELNNAYRQIGRSADEAFGHVTKKAHDLFARGAIGGDLFKNLMRRSNQWQQANGSAEGINLALTHARIDTENQAKVEAKRKKAEEARAARERSALERVEDFTSALSKLALAAYAVIKPFREVEQFAKQFQQINLQRDLQARGAVTSVTDLAGMGGALARFGGSEAEAAKFKRSFELAMENRRIGKGDGGQFTEALKRYGIDYSPGDSNATLRSIIQWMSAPGNKGTVRAQNAGAMLGLSPAFVAAAERGLEAWDREAKAMQNLTLHREAAAKGAEDLAAETAKLGAAWQNLKDGIALDLLPAIKAVTQWLTKAGKALDNKTARSLIEVAVGLGMLASVIGGLAKGGKALCKIFGRGGATGGIAGGVSSGAGSTAGGAAAGIGKGAGSAVAGLLVGVFDAVAGTMQRGDLQLLIAEIRSTVAQWHNEWFVHTVAISGSADLVSGKDSRLLRWSRKNGVGDDLLYAGLAMRSFLQKQFEEIQNLQTLNPGMPIASAPSISITGGVTISVQSDSADPVLVADEVRKVIIDEFGVLADNASAVVA